jgi:hypothetical protein
MSPILSSSRRQKRVSLGCGGMTPRLSTPQGHKENELLGIRTLWEASRSGGGGKINLTGTRHTVKS